MALPTLPPVAHRATRARPPVQDGPRRAVIYTRISDDDGTALGVARQEQDCRDLAEHHGWEVVLVCVDNDVSAFSGRRRPGYQRMLDALHSGEASAAIVWDLDRLTRTPRELEDFITAADRGGWELASVGGDTDLATPQGRLVARIKGNVARHESEQASRRIKRKIDERAAAGLPHGRVPYGWRRVVEHDEQGRPRSTDVLDPTEAAVITEATELVVAGHSVRSVVMDLNRRGLPSPSGLPWVATTLRQVLSRERNAGLRRHRGEVVGEGAWPAIVERATYERLMATLTDPNRRTAPGNVPRWLLTGIATCGADGCGAPLRIAGPGGRVRRHRYVCPECFGVARVADFVDELVRDVVVGRLARPDAARTLAAPQRAGVDALAEAAALTARLAEAADAFAEGAITAAQLTRITGQLRPLLEAAEARARGQLAIPDLADLARPDAAAAWDRLPLERQRAVVRLLVDVVVLPVSRRNSGRDVDGVAITWRTSTATQASA